MEGRSSANQLVSLIKSQACLESNNTMEAAKDFTYLIRKVPEPISKETAAAISRIKEAFHKQEFNDVTEQAFSVLKNALDSVDDPLIKEALVCVSKVIAKKEFFKKKEFASFSEHFMRVYPRPLDNKSGSLLLLPDEERMKFSKDWQAKVKTLSSLFENMALPIANLKVFLADLQEELEGMVRDDINFVRLVILEEGVIKETELEEKLATLKAAYAFHLFTDVGTNPKYVFNWSKNGKLEIIRALNMTVFESDISTHFWLRLKEGLAQRTSSFVALKKFRNLLGEKLADDLYVEAVKEIEISKLTDYLNGILSTKEAECEVLTQRVLHALIDRISQKKFEGEELQEYLHALHEGARTDLNESKNKKVCAEFSGLIKRAENQLKKEQKEHSKAEKKEINRAAKKEKKEQKQKHKQEKKERKAQEKKQAAKEKRHKKEIKSSVPHWAKQAETEEESLPSPRLRSVTIEKGKARIKPPKEKERKTTFGLFQNASHRNLKTEVSKEERTEKLRILNRFTKFHKTEKIGSSEGSQIGKSPRENTQEGSQIGKSPRENTQEGSQIGKSPRENTHGGSQIGKRENLQGGSRIRSKEPPRTPKAYNPRMAYKQAGSTPFAFSDTDISYGPKKNGRG